MTPEEKLRGIESWRGMEMLTPFFGISCACEGLEETTFGEIVDFLLSSLREKEREIRELKNEVITIDEALQVAVLARDQWEVKNKSAESRLSTLIERAAQVAKEKGSLLQKTNAYRGHISVQVAADYCNEIATDIRNLGKEGK